MSVTITYTNYFKYALAKKLIELTSDTVKVLLMRSGFSFDQDKHRELKNIQTTDTEVTYAINSSHELIDSANGFITLGLVPGNSLNMSGFTSGGNNVTKIISTVAAGTIVFTNTTGLVEEAEGDSVTITSDDELATLYGYTQGTKTTGTITLTENTTDNRADASYPTVSWTASGGDIGPTPGAILYDETADVIIQYINFGTEITVASSSLLNILSGTLKVS